MIVFIQKGLVSTRILIEESNTIAEVIHKYVFQRCMGWRPEDFDLYLDSEMLERRLQVCDFNIQEGTTLRICSNLSTPDLTDDDDGPTTNGFRLNDDTDSEVD